MMPDKERLLQVACTAYQAWLKVDKDYARFSHVFDAWDEAVTLYMNAANVSRARALVHVEVALGLVRGF